MRVPAFARLLVGAVLIGAVWFALDRSDAVTRLRDIRAGWVVAAIFALSVQTVLAAWRWRVTAGQLGVHIGPLRAVREYYLAQLVNQTLPGGMVGDVGRVMRSAGTAGPVRAGQAVVLERLMGNAMLLAVMLGAVLVMWLMPDTPGLPSAMLHLIAAATATIPLALLLLRLPVGQNRLARLAASVRGAVAVGLLSRAVLPKQLLLSLATVLANLCAFGVAAHATGTALPALSALIVLPPILFTMMIPVSASGWGLREGAAAALFPVAGFSPEAGLAASVAFGLIFLLSSLPGLVVMLCDAAGNASHDKGVGPARPGAR